MNKFLILLVLFSVVVATIDANPTATPAPPTANTKCPCLAEGSKSAFVTTSNDEKGDLLRVTPTTDGTYYYYPKNYGQGKCAYWDDKTLPHCAEQSGAVSYPQIGTPKAGRADWCAKAWCYVDKNNCDAEFAPATSGYLVDSSGTQHYYSYLTCGHTDTYTSSRMDIIDRADPEPCGKNCKK